MTFIVHELPNSFENDVYISFISAVTVGLMIWKADTKWRIAFLF